MSGFSRRRLLTAGIIGGVLAATGMKATAQRRGGELRLALGGGGDWYPGRADSDLARVLTASTHDCLTEVTATGELIGELADYWDASADARIWTLTLRRGVRFHDGADFGADDVAASLLWHDRAYPFLTDIDEVAALTPHQVRITLRAGNADFPFLLSDPRLVMFSAADLEAGPGAVNGTGLYQYDGQGDHGLTLVRVAGHYKDGTAGWFDGLWLIRADTAAERMAALLTGAADAAATLDPGQAPSLRGDIVLTTLSGLGELSLTMPDRTAVRLAPETLAALGRQADDPAIAALLARAGLTLSTGQQAAALTLALRLRQPTEDCTLAGLCETPEDLALLHLARAAADGPERATLFAQLRDQIDRRGTLAVPVDFFDGHAAALRHPETLGITAPLDGGRIAERWWFA
jgi:hypothetical protein